MNDKKMKDKTKNNKNKINNMRVIVLLNVFFLGGNLTLLSISIPLW